MAKAAETPEIRKGVIFDTEYEAGCVALDWPNSHGEVLALDSDGVKAWYHVAMIRNPRES